MTANVKIRVALVEDDPAARDALEQAITEAPDLQLAWSAAGRCEALGRLGRAPLDVLLVDLGLPDGSGIEVIGAVQVRWPACQVVVSTVFADDRHVLQAIQAGASGYLLKDSDPMRIVQEIRSVHAGASPMSPLIARKVMQMLRGDGATAADATAARPPGGPAPGPAALSARESQVLRLVSVGFTYDEIAQRLSLSRHTVMTFIRRVYAKLEVNSKMEAVNAARRQGLLAD